MVRGEPVGSTQMAPFTDVDFDADPDWDFRTAQDDPPDGSCCTCIRRVRRALGCPV